MIFRAFRYLVTFVPLILVYLIILWDCLHATTTQHSTRQTSKLEGPVTRE